MAAPVRVKIAPGVVLHRGASGLPFRAGDVVELPADHAADLKTRGHVQDEAAEAAPPAAPPA